jgi:hypothetical protein
MNRGLDSDLYDFFAWWADTLAGGYPSRSRIGRVMEIGFSEPPPCGSSVPKGAMINCPPHVARLNGVMDHVPDRFDAVLRLRYIERGKMRTTQWARLRELHSFIEGALSMVSPPDDMKSQRLRMG